MSNPDNKSTDQSKTSERPNEQYEDQSYAEYRDGMHPSRFTPTPPPVQNQKQRSGKPLQDSGNPQKVRKNSELTSSEKE